MNVITSTDGRALMTDISMAMGGLEGLRYNARAARLVLDMVRLEIPVVESYAGPDAQSYRDSLQKRLTSLEDALRQAQMELADAEQADAIRRSQAAQQASVSGQQIAYMVRTLSKVEAWLDGLHLSKPADDDFHKRLLMRNEVSHVRDLLLNATVQPVSISND